MKQITIKNKEVTLKYTFNSFNYMEDLDFGELDVIQTKPFKIIKVLRTLLLGAVNSDPKVAFSEMDVMEYIENFTADETSEETLVDLTKNLIDLLQESNFFKNLQKNNKQEK